MTNTMITSGNWRNFLTLEGEKLLLVKRSHPFVVILPSIALFVLTLLLLIILFFFLIVLTSAVQLFLVSSLVIISLFFTFLMKCILDWHFHLYILTTRKILEVWYTPLYSYIVNDVLLDSVNCTQIDIQRNGLFEELLDMGDIVITFDRPTHQDEFVLRNIKQCYQLSTYLTKSLIETSANKDPGKNQLWFRYPRRI